MIRRKRVEVEFGQEVPSSGHPIVEYVTFEQVHNDDRDSAIDEKVIRCVAWEIDRSYAKPVPNIYEIAEGSPREIFKWADELFFVFAKLK